MKYTEAELRAVALDARYSDVGNLPSNFRPYSFKKLLVRPFTVLELRLISKAAVLKEPVHLLQAINLVISEDVMNITLGDFYYLLMWLRIHSMPKTPYVIEWVCSANAVLGKDGKRLFYDEADFDRRSTEDGISYVPCGTHNSEIIHLSDVEIISLDDDFERLPVAEEEGVEFDFPRVNDLVALQEAVEDPELRMIAAAAQWIKAPSLEEKIKILEAQPNLDLFDTAAVINEQVVHGIRETATLSCRGCGIKRPHTLALDALSFFR